MSVWRKSIIISVAIAALVFGAVGSASASNQRAQQYNVNDRAGVIYEYARPDGTSVHVNIYQREKHNVEAHGEMGTPAISRHVGVIMIETDANGNVYAETLATMKAGTALSCCLDRSRIRSYGGGIKYTLVDGEWVPKFVVIDVDVKLTGTGKITTEQQAWTGVVQSTGAGWPMMSVEKRRGGLASGYARIDGASVTGNASAKRIVALKTQRETVLPQ